MACSSRPVAGSDFADTIRTADRSRHVPAVTRCRNTTVLLVTETLQARYVRSGARSIRSCTSARKSRWRVLLSHSRGPSGKSVPQVGSAGRSSAATASAVACCVAQVACCNTGGDNSHVPWHAQAQTGRTTECRRATPRSCSFLARASHIRAGTFVPNLRAAGSGSGCHGYSRQVLSAFPLPEVRPRPLQSTGFLYGVLSVYRAQYFAGHNASLRPTWRSWTNGRRALAACHANSRVRCMA